MDPGPRSTFLPKDHTGGPSTRNTSVPSPGTTHAQPAVLLSQKLENNLEGPIL